MKLGQRNAPVTLHGWAVPAALKDPGCRTRVNLGHPGSNLADTRVIGDHRGHPGCAGTLENSFEMFKTFVARPGSLPVF